MNKKLLIMVFIAGMVLGGGAIYLFTGTSSSGTHKHEVAENKEGKQLYTCGMHPDVVSEEPGDCPICGMRLNPIKNSGKKKTSGERKIIYWRAPMNPSEIYDKPGKSKMGMDLVPVYEDEVSGEGVVSIDPVVQQNMNVKIEEVKVKTLNSEVITNGILKIDERKEFILTTKTSGWIEKLYVNFTGQEVKKGEKLLEIYSPQLVATQEELLTALSYSETTNKSKNIDILGSGNELVERAKDKLRLLDVPEETINILIKEKKVKRTLVLRAPFNGTVIHKGVTEGQKINAGTPLLKIADLTNLWLMADIYEYELSKISLGSEAEVRFNFFPSKIYNAKVTFIYPTLDNKTRTVKVRLDIPNKNKELKPDMFANVVIKGKEFSGYPVVPEQAILRNGRENIMIIALGEGRFKPVKVKLGGYSNGEYQVVEGLTAGTKIVTSAQFLIDSESSLKSAIKNFSKSEPEKEIATEKSINKKDMKNMEMKEDSNVNHKHPEEEDIVRKGVIDLKAIDKNNDGKVFQDLMDWNVLADEYHRCPLCNMKMQEVSIEEAKKNLLENGYKVK